MFKPSKNQKKALHNKDIILHPLAVDPSRAKIPNFIYFAKKIIKKGKVFLYVLL